MLISWVITLRYLEIYSNLFPDIPWFTWTLPAILRDIARFTRKLFNNFLRFIVKVLLIFQDFTWKLFRYSPICGHLFSYFLLFITTFFCDILWFSTPIFTYLAVRSVNIRSEPFGILWNFAQTYRLIFQLLLGPIIRFYPIFTDLPLRNIT